jgi:hypothetical protein
MARVIKYGALPGAEEQALRIMKDHLDHVLLQMMTFGPPVPEEQQ